MNSDAPNQTAAPQVTGDGLRDELAKDHTIVGIAEDGGFSLEWVVNQVMVVASPALQGAYLNGHDAGYAAANAGGPWAEQQPVVDSELRDRIARAGIAKFREYTGTKPDQNMWNLDMEKTFHLVAEAQAAVVAPVLAERDKLQAELKFAEATRQQYAEERDQAHAESDAIRDALDGLILDVDCELPDGTTQSAGMSLPDYIAAMRAELERERSRHVQRDEVNAGWVRYKERKSQEYRKHREALGEALGISEAERRFHPIPVMVEAVANMRHERDALADSTEPFGGCHVTGEDARAWIRQCESEVDLLLWLHAEAVWQRDTVHADLRIRAGALADVLRAPRGTDYYAMVDLVEQLRKDRDELDDVDAGATEQAYVPTDWEPSDDEEIDNPVSSTVIDVPATPTEPRVWQAHAPMPDDVWKVRDRHGDVWTRNVADSWESPDTMPCGWPYLTRKWAPLTEVAHEAPGGET